MQERDAADHADIAAIHESHGARHDLLLGAFLQKKEPLVRQLAMKTARQEKIVEDEEDILQAARIGMMNALKDYNPDKGALSTWAGWKIRKEIQELARKAETIKRPRIRLRNEERNATVLALRKNPTATADELGIKPNVLEQVKLSIGMRFISFDIPRDSEAPNADWLERRATMAVETIDIDEQLDLARADRIRQEILARVRRRPHATPELLGITPEQHAAALECLELQPGRRRIYMVDSMNGVSAPAAAAPKTKTKRNSKDPYEEALRAVVASKLGRLSVAELEAIAAKILAPTAKAA